MVSFGETFVLFQRNCTMAVFDVNLESAPDSPPEFLAGAVIHGAQAAKNCTSLKLLRPSARWFHAADLSVIVGPSDARFPGDSPAVINFRLDNLQRQFRKPAADWWPLMDAISRSGQVLRVLL